MVGTSNPAGSGGEVLNVVGLVMSTMVAMAIYSRVSRKREVLYQSGI